MPTTGNLPLHLRRSVSIRPISAVGWQAMSGDRRFTHASAWANHVYIMRGAGSDDRGTLDYRHRTDLVAHGLELPSRHPVWATEDGRIWRELDAATATLAPDAIRAWHLVVTLPPELDEDQWIATVRRYAREVIAVHGPAVAWAIHAPEAPDAHPHAHLLMTTRVWRHDAHHGQSVPGWCGPSMRQRLHAEWLSTLPDEMRQAATSAYRAGSLAPAHPDCSALEQLFEREAKERRRRKPRKRSFRIRKVEDRAKRAEAKMKEVVAASPHPPTL
ncbi:hypothetical protein BV96_01256 [Sphingomonas paucimobilis]|nr:hypothetical protein BV96_01256 [Sphingomonas paucimobilis]